MSCRAVQHSRAGLEGADAAEAGGVTVTVTASGTGMGTGTGSVSGVVTAARGLWDAMVQKGLPVCYQSGPVLSSALLFMFTLDDSPRERDRDRDRDRDRGQKSEAGKEGDVTESVGGVEWNRVPGPGPSRDLQDAGMDTKHPSLGIQVTT